MGGDDHSVCVAWTNWSSFCRSCHNSKAYWILSGIKFLWDSYEISFVYIKNTFQFLHRPFIYQYATIAQFPLNSRGLPLIGQGQPGCKNIRAGGESVKLGDGGPYMTYFVYRSFARESNAHLMLQQWLHREKTALDLHFYGTSSMVDLMLLVLIYAYLRLMAKIEAEKGVVKIPFLDIRFWNSHIMTKGCRMLTAFTSTVFNDH